MTVVILIIATLAALLMTGASSVFDRAKKAQAKNDLTQIMKKTRTLVKCSMAAFSLVEVTLAVGVAAFCLVAILGLLPTALKVNQDSTQRTTANGILSMVVANIRAIPKSDTGTKENKRYFPSIGNTNYVYFSNIGSNDDGDKPEQAASDSIFQVAITNVSPPSWRRTEQHC